VKGSNSANGCSGGIQEEREDMTEEKDETTKEQSPEEGKKETEQDLPVCTTAADPEHLRGIDMEVEEPCDDAREGKVEEK
jgi:hypothetical protein